MPITFVQVGRHWINLELVTSIEIVEDPNQPGTIIGAMVHYSTGKQQLFKMPAEVQALEAFLRTHKAP